MDPVKPRELVTAARVADALVYAAGVAGIVAGAMLFRDDQVGFAVVAWALARPGRGRGPPRRAGPGGPGPLPALGRVALRR
jgi:hypothetical protein